MKQATKGIASNGIIVFDRDFTVKDLKAIPKDFCGDIVVHGDIELFVAETEEYAPLITKCCVWCEGDVYCNNIICESSIYVKGVIHAVDIVCAEDIDCTGEMDFGNLECLGDVFCGGYFYSDTGRLIIKGTLECKNVETG